MAEQLRLQASVTDNATGPLRKIREELAAFRETEEIKSLKESMKVLREQTAEFTKATAGASAGMGGIGIGSLAASVSVGELVKTFRELADRAADLRSLSKETGLTVDSINQLEHVAERFHVSPEKMATALTVLSDQMVDFRRHTGSLFAELNQQRPEIAKRLLGENPQQQIQEIFRFLDTIPNEEVRKRWSKAIFGDGDISKLLEEGYKGFAEAQAEAAQSVPKITAEYQRQADEFHKSILEFNASMERLEMTVAPAVFKDLKEAADEFKDAFAQVKEAWEWAKGAKADPGKAIGAAGDSWLEQQHKINEERRKAGHGPWIDLPETAIDLKKWLHGQDAGSPENKFVPPDQRDINPLLHKSSFGPSRGVNLGSGGPADTFGLKDIIQAGTRAGVVQGLQDFEDLKNAQDSAGGGQGRGFMHLASLEGGGLDGAGAGGGRRRRAGGPGGGSGSGVDPVTSKALGVAARGEHAAFIRATAASLGIDPNIALRVAASEGLNQPFAGGDKGTSYGDFQMHYKNHIPGLSLGGLGDVFNKETGLDGRDPKNWRQLDEFALRYAAKHGWGPWHGAAAKHIYGFTGIGTVSKAGREAAAAALAGGKVSPEQRLPKGGYWAKDSKGNPVAVGPDGQSLGLDGKPATVASSEAKSDPFFLPDAAQERRAHDLWAHARSAGMLGGKQVIEHKGGADITIRGLPSGTSTHTKTQGLVSSVKLNRSSTMPDLNWN